MGFPHVVGLMGWAMSEEQTRIVIDLVSKAGRIWIVTDGDEAGDRCASEAFLRLGSVRFMKRLKLDEGKQPTDYPGGWYQDQLK